MLKLVLQLMVENTICIIVNFTNTSFFFTAAEMAGSKKEVRVLDPFKIFLYLSLCGFLTLLCVGYTVSMNSIQLIRFCLRGLKSSVYEL